jgi:hypothetical protein
MADKAELNQKLARNKTIGGLPCAPYITDAQHHAKDNRNENNQTMLDPERRRGFTGKDKCFNLA